ncbi:MAG: phosphorylase [Acidobacteriota bacterium]|nr:phosphorylase [Acidobacteriota bacterium]
MRPSPLRQALTETTEKALAKGALRTIPTHFDYLEQDGVHFLVRVLDNLARKDKAKKKQDAKGPDFNPFLPYEQDLFVADLGPAHVALLNKFNVVDHHLLMITRDFEHQSELLTAADFSALWACLAEIDGLAFYNGGLEAGASQKHKHLQLVPLPLVDRGPAVPISPLLPADNERSDRLPFEHRFARMATDRQQPERAADEMFEHYHRAMHNLGLWGNGKRQAGPYNLIATREWMMVAPRSRESYRGIGVNALGFAGTLLVRNDEMSALLKTIGPLDLLAEVGIRSN